MVFTTDKFSAKPKSNNISTKMFNMLFVINKEESGKFNMQRFSNIIPGTNGLNTFYVESIKVCGLFKHAYK